MNNLTASVDSRFIKLVFYGLAILTFVIFSVLFSVAYVHVEHPAYLWDWGGYWRSYKQYGQLAVTGDLSWLAKLRSEIATSDYNPSSIIPLIPVYVLFGGDRAVYIAATAVFYLVPVVFIAAALTEAFFRPSKIQPAFRPSKIQPAILLLAFLYTLFWAPTLRGMIDIVGLIPLGLATLILFRTDFFSKANWKHAVAFGGLIWCTFLLRRWYAFSIVSLVVVAGFFAIATIRQAEDWNKAASRICLLYALAGLTTLALAGSFQAPLLLRIIDTSYRDVYSGYQKPLWEQLLYYYKSAGFFVAVFICCGLGAAVFKRDKLTIFLGLVAGFTAWLFSRVAAPDPQHLLPVAFFLFPAYSSGTHSLVQMLPNRVGWGVVLAAAVLNFVSTFVPLGWGKAELIRSIFPVSRVYPLQVENYAEYRRMLQDIEKLPQDARLAVFASSDVLSDGLISALEPNVTPRIIWASQVDLRDYFDWRTLNADYVLIGTPTPIHLPENAQRVITLPAEEIRSNFGIGMAFEKVGPEYRLSQNVIGQIYKKVRTFSSEEIKRLADELYEFYPEWRAIDRKNVGVPLLTAIISLGDKWGNVSQISNHELFVHPGDALPTSVEFPLSAISAVKAIDIHIPGELLQTCPDSDGVGLKLESSEGILFNGRILPGTLQRVEPSLSEWLRISVSPLKNPHCDHVTLSFSFAE